MEDEFTDEVWIRAADGVTETVDQICQDIGRLPTMEEFARIFTLAVRGSPRTLFADAANATVTVALKSRRTRGRAPKYGDLIGVPVRRRFFPLVCLGQCGSFGTAMGVVLTTETSQTLEHRTWSPSRVKRHPIFTEPTPVVAGHWPVFGSRMDLVDRFETPQRYYAPSAAHPFGASEDLDGVVRSLRKTEAARIFGRKGEWTKQSYLWEELAETLEVNIDAPR